MISFLIDFSTAILTQVTAVFVFQKLSDKKLSFKSGYVFLFIIAGIIQISLNIYGFNTIGTLFTIIYFYFMFQKMFLCSKKESQNYSIIIWTISLLIDIFLMMLGTTLNLMYLYEIDAKLYKSFASLIMSIILIIIVNTNFIVKQLRKIYQKLCKLNITKNHILITIILFLFIGMMSSNNMNNQFLITLFFSIGIIILVIIIMFLSMNYEIITLKITNEILEKNNEANQKVIYQFRILKHNLESQLMGVKTVANKKAKELLDNLIKEYNESFYIKHDINSMPLGINGLIFEKLYKYNEDKIEISITNKIKSKILNAVGPRSYNLFCEALGVTLDNALESAKESKDKLVYIEFRENKDYVQMKIMNTFHGNIDLDKLGTVNYTSKSEGHGLGLYSLFGRKNLTITTSIKNNLFVNKIEVKKLKK